MDTAITRTRLALGAAAVLCLVVVVPIAAAGAAGGSGDPQATASASVKKQVKKLKKQVKKLKGQVEEVSKQPGPQGQQGEKGEKGDPGEPGLSTGPAGGDLTGNYPNPLIAGGAVTNPKLANNAVNSAKVANNSLTGADIDEATLAIPTAHARVDPDGTATSTKGISAGDVTKVGTGVYCIDAAASNIQASGGMNSGAGASVAVAVDGQMLDDIFGDSDLTDFGCAASDDFAVLTVDSTGTSVNAYFWMALF